MIAALPQLPSYSQGFARRRGESACFGLWSGLVGLWAPCLGPTGASLWDWSGYGNHGALTNMDVATDWRAGPCGWSLDLDGYNDYVYVPYSPVFQLGTRLSIEMLVRRNGGLDVNRGLLVRRTPGGGDTQYSLYFNSDNKLWVYIRDTTPTWRSFVGNAAVTDSNWHHVGFTWDGSVATTWIDGRQDNSGAFNYTPIQSDTAVLWIGSDLGTIRYFPGQIAYVGLWRRSLAGEEMARLAAGPHALLQLTRRALGTRWAIGGPYQVVAGQTFHTGAQMGQLFHTGATEGELLGT